MSPFRTIEVSDPDLEAGGLRWITAKSAALGGRADIAVHVPRAARGLTSVPAAILLHGVYGSAWAWAFKGGACATCEAETGAGKIPPVALVMPSDGLWGDGSGYLPHRGADFERWIADEVVEAATLAVPEIDAGSRWSIAGLSMGGYGALRIAARRPDRFAAAAGMSSITRFAELLEFVEEPAAAFDLPPDADLDLEPLLTREGARMRFRFDCGLEDPLLASNRRLHEALAAAGIEHEYREHPGGHDWAYWRARLPETLAFLLA